MPATLDLPNPPVDLLEAATALDPDRLDYLVSQLLRLRAGRNASRLSKDEATLLAQINSGPAPDVWMSYNQLRESYLQQTLTQEDQRELIRLTDSVEQYQAERAAALAELATLRGQSLTQLMDWLALENQSDRPLGIRESI